jgi:pimeloyl-ACP methyl ester carboxylesterase
LESLLELAAMDFDLVSRLLFPAPPASYTVDSFPGELIWIPRSLNPQTSSPEDCVPCALLRCKTAQLLVIYLHSNYEDLGRAYSFLQQIRDRFEVHVLAVEYPGYGICPGRKCDERGATESALTAFRFAREVLRWPSDRILFLGRSVGTGPAITLAVEHAVKGLCLISPFLSVREVCRDVFGPISYMIEERFPNKDHMPMIRSPCLVIHGQKDHTIPFRHGRELFDSCRSRKRLVSPPEMDHNANLLHDSENFVQPMLEFFSLPSQGLEEMQVPSWAFDKRLSPFFVESPVLGPDMRKMASSSLFGSCTACTACGKCATGPNPKAVSSTAGPWDGDLVEETITGAIEHVLGRKDDLLWSEADVSIDSPGQEMPQSLPAASEIIASRGSRGLADMLPMGEGLSKFASSELPLPPSDDAVAVVPHATVRRYPGRVPTIGAKVGAVPIPAQPVLPRGGSGSARPMMSWRPHVPPKIVDQSSAVVQSLDEPDSPESTFDDFNEVADSTLMRI